MTDVTQAVETLFYHRIAGCLRFHTNRAVYLPRSDNCRAHEGDCDGLHSLKLSSYVEGVNEVMVV